MLAPIFEEASNLVAREYPNPGVVVFGKVDCDSQRKLSNIVVFGNLRQFLLYIIYVVKNIS